MECKSIEALLRFNIPQFDSLIGRRGQQLAAVFRPPARVNRAAVPIRYLNFFLTRFAVVKCNFFIRSHGTEQITIWRIAYTINEVLVCLLV